MFNRLFLAAVAAGLLALAGPALAQTASGIPPVYDTGHGSQQAQGVAVVGLENGTGARCIIGSDTTCKEPIAGTFSASLGVAALTSTQTNGAVTTHLTFQTALAANGSRNGCTIQNRSTDTELVFFGANGSASNAKAFALGPASVTGGAGGAISCSVGGLGVATDNIAITSLTADGATYSVASQ